LEEFDSEDINRAWENIKEVIKTSVKRVQVIMNGNSINQGLMWSGLVYLFIHSVTLVILDMSITDYNLYSTTQLIMCGHPPNII
jgi:hypothetical protein